MVVLAMRISYGGKVSAANMYKCHMCSAMTRDRYLAIPDLPDLADWKEMFLCKKCARREIGSKNAKGWDRIHEERDSS